MREADTILAIIRDRGRRGLPLERVYRLLFNPNLYLRAYMRLYPNRGALTPGSTPETVDGMSQVKLDRLIEDVRYERYRWTPVRRVRIPKPKGTGTRPLGIPTWKDKLLQEVLRSILEAYFEPQFSDHSHGFRPSRGCHTALREITQSWTGVRWFIEGDIAHCFDTLNHDVLLAILKAHIRDERFLRLIRDLLVAGYLEGWKFHQTLSGAPQGGVLSPLLSNIYLNQFDQWVEKTLVPAYTQGARRRPNPPYEQIRYRLRCMRQDGQPEGVKALVQQRRQTPSVDPHDPHYRRLRYVRYADDFLLGYAGTKAEAEDLKRQLTEWLHDHLQLTLSREKTLITHATTQAARFLGYDIRCSYADDKLDKTKRRSINRKPHLRVPAEVVNAKCARYLKQGRIWHRPEMLDDSDYTIMNHYQQVYRGVVNYYLHAHNVACLSKLHWVMQTSLLKTLAAKRKTTIGYILNHYATTVVTPTGKRLKCLEVRVERPEKPPLVARFGGISLTRQPYASLNDRPFIDKGRRVELLQRLLADQCEVCGARESVQVHHIRKLADLDQKGRKTKPAWMQQMAARRRKTLVVCHTCHWNIHAGRAARQTTTE
jgi:group II intron reverse transcriptase/maturase